MRGFQSPSGVLGVCREKTFDTSAAALKGVSVPFRGFRGLQASSAVRIIGAGVMAFQSPSGVLGVCRARAVLATLASPAVIGVSVPFRGFRGLQAEGSDTHATFLKGFSPLPGF